MKENKDTRIISYKNIYANIISFLSGGREQIREKNNFVACDGKYIQYKRNKNIYSIEYLFYKIVQLFFYYIQYSINFSLFRIIFYFNVHSIDNLKKDIKKVFCE